MDEAPTPEVILQGSTKRDFLGSDDEDEPDNKRRESRCPNLSVAHLKQRVDNSVGISIRTLADKNKMVRFSKILGVR
jgi:hypothetical protein